MLMYMEEAFFIGKVLRCLRIFNRKKRYCSAEIRLILQCVKKLPLVGEKGNYCNFGHDVHTYNGRGKYEM